MKKLLHMFLACMMLLACATTAFASPSADSPELYEGVVPVQGDPIGTIEDQDGVLLQDIESRSGRLPFTMTAINISNLLTTMSSPGKCFTGRSFSTSRGEGLLITGKVTNTAGYDVRVGACSYQPANGIFFSVYPLYFQSGVQSTGFIPRVDGTTAYFTAQETYYGHITNYQGVGTVSGELRFSVSTRP